MSQRNSSLFLQNDIILTQQTTRVHYCLKLVSPRGFHDMSANSTWKTRATFRSFSLPTKE